MGSAPSLVPPGSRLLRDPMDEALRPRPGGDVKLVGVPWDWSAAGRPGARFAPQRVRAALYSMRGHAPGLGADLQIQVEDLGDVRVAPGDPSLTFRRVVEAAELAYSGRLAVFLGGDHSISRWTVEPLTRRGRVGLLVLDAHYDMRSVEEGLTSGSWLYELLEARRGRVAAAVVGVADFANPRYLGERAAKLGVHVVPAWRIAREGVEAAGEAVEHLLESGAEEYYISVDVDHVAEAWAPGVNAPSPLGLDPRESAAILLEASRRLRPRGIDVVEVSPPYDVGDATSRLAAALLLYAIYGALRG